MIASSAAITSVRSTSLFLNCSRRLNVLAGVQVFHAGSSHFSSFAPAESLQLMRIELPRSALVSFGLPMNVERADQRIKADVLVGNDGVARAIRFVR